MQVDVTISQSFSIEAAFKQKLEAVITFPSLAPSPKITEIDGGDSGPDSQFAPINGLLDGGEA